MTLYSIIENNAILVNTISGEAQTYSAWLKETKEEGYHENSGENGDDLTPEAYVESCIEDRGLVPQGE